jgi:hypothetical protein
VHKSTLTPPVSSIHPQSRSERIRLTRAATGLKPAEKLLLRSLVDFMGNATECWPSLSRLADEVGCSIRHVRRMLRSLEAAGWIVTQSRFRPDRSQTSCVFQWAKAPDLHVRPPRTSASGLEFNIGSIQESNTYAAAAECDFEQEDKTPVAAKTLWPIDHNVAAIAPAANPRDNCPQGTSPVAAEKVGQICPRVIAPAAELPVNGPVNWPDLNGKAADSVPVNCPEQNGTAPVAAELQANCPEGKPMANLPQVLSKANCPDSGRANCPQATGKAPDSVRDNCPEQNEGTESNLPASSAVLPSSKPAIPAAPAIRSRKPSPKFIVIDGSKFLDINHGKDIYLAAVAGKLLNSGTVDRLAFFACWCAIAAKLRAGKVQHPERMMRFLLDNRKAMSAYPDHAAEVKARDAVRFLFPEKPYNPHC